MQVSGFLLAFLAILGLSTAYTVDYTGFSIQRCPVEFEDMRDLIQGVVRAFNVDVVAEGPSDIEVLVTPKLREIFKGLHCKVVVEDVQQEIKAEQLSLKLSREAYLTNLNDTDAYHKTYHRYSEIVAKLREIASLYPSIATYSTYGSSLEGRALPMIRLAGTSSAAKKVIYINSGIHAREWIGPAATVYIIQRLAEQYGRDATVTRLLDAIEFYFTPASNPDGYEFSHTDDRMWRKNRNSNGNNACYGVDLNRNFDVYWGTQSSSTKCAQDYHGTSAASEPEVRAIQNLVAGFKNKIGAIDIHAYGQYIMRPYGWTYNRHPDEAILKQLGDGIVAKIEAVNGVEYSSIRSADLYPVSGASDDWFTVKQNLWGFCFELRDEGRYGFRLPEAQILPTGQEVFAAIVHYADFVLSNFEAKN